MEGTEEVKISRFYLPVLLFAAALRGNVWTWDALVSTREVTVFAPADSVLWIGSTGGLMAFSANTRSFQIFTQTDGLAAGPVQGLLFDSDRRLWIGYESGMLLLREAEKETWIPFELYMPHAISDFTQQGDSLFVALNLGISLFIPSRMEVKETYRRLGDFPANTPVNSVVLFQDTLWAATESGIARASLSAPNLMDPAQWENITLEDGLPVNTVFALAVLDGVLYAATPAGLAAWSGEWSVLTTRYCYDVTVHEGILAVSTVNGLFELKEGWLQKLPDAPRAVNRIISFNSMLWGGTDDGIAGIDSLETWHEYVPDCLGSNLVSAITTDRQGNLWVCSRDRGFFKYDGDQWLIYDRDNTPDIRYNDFVCCRADNNDNVWIGSYGDGAFRVNTDGEINAYNAFNGYFSGIQVDDKFAVCLDIAVDNMNTVWFLNRESADAQPLIARSADGQWTRYGFQQQLNSIFVSDLAVDEYGRKWIGTAALDARGIYILDDNQTPSNVMDDPPVERINTANGLPTNEITHIAAGGNGLMWIGTPGGLYYVLGTQVTRQSGVPSDNIRALTVDGMNNVWVGTTAGLSFFNQSTFQWTHFTTDNSPLLSHDISTLFLDPASGFLYIGTNRGISILRTPYSKPLESLEELKVYPNPFRPDQHGLVTIDRLAQDVTVHIFSTSGYLVRGFSKSGIAGRRVQWDGKDASGNAVPSGIYLVVAARTGGKSVTGKIALIR